MIPLSPPKSYFYDIFQNRYAEILKYSKMEAEWGLSFWTIELLKYSYIKMHF